MDRTRLNAIARDRGLRVIEDAAQSMGATWQGQRIGAIGDLVSISFHANKNLTTAEGGCLVLNDAQEARRCELWRLQGVERLAAVSYTHLDVYKRQLQGGPWPGGPLHRKRAAAARHRSRFHPCAWQGGDVQLRI